MRIYVASSWRNNVQPRVVDMLRDAGHWVYDFKNPREDDHGFHWSEIDRSWLSWDFETYRTALRHQVAEAGFKSDFDAMKWADSCVLVLPCGRSAHLEAGWFVGKGKPLIIFLCGDLEPELMYKMATAICITHNEVLDALAEIENEMHQEAEPHNTVSREMALDAGDPSLEGTPF